MLADYGGIEIYGVEGQRTFVQSGTGRVIGRDFNQIELSGVRGPALVLRYNWVQGLETVPPSQIEAYQWSPDFPPLVRIINPPTNFTLRLER